MESFRQHIWTSYQPVMGELPTIENAMEPLEWPDMDGSFTDIPMANYPPPPLIAERNAAPTYVNLDNGIPEQTNGPHVNDFDPENLPAGNHPFLSYLYINYI